MDSVEASDGLDRLRVPLEALALTRVSIIRSVCKDGHPLPNRVPLDVCICVLGLVTRLESSLVALLWKTS